MKEVKVDLNKLKTLETSDDSGSLESRVIRNRHHQETSKKLRTICRIGILIFGVSGFCSFFLSYALSSQLLLSLGGVLMLCTMVFAGILFFLGGLASGKVKRVLNEKERRQLDD